MLDGWKTIRLGEISKITSGISPSNFQMKKNGIPYYKVEQLNLSNKYLESTPYHIDSCKNLVDKSSIIFPKRGASIMLNKIRLLRFDSFMDTNLMTLTINNDYSFEYIYYYLLFSNLSEVADTTSVPQINNKHIIPYEILIPERKCEQEAIARALSNIDYLIDYLQKLVAKKNKLFEASKQNLLCGVHRHGLWKKVRIGDIGIFDGNGVDKKINKGEKKVRLLNYMDIMHNDFIYDNMSKHFVTASDEKYNKCLVKKGDIFLTPSSETREDIGVSAVALEDSDDLVYSYHIVRFRPTIDMDMKFRAYLFQNQKFLNQASKYCEGSGKRYVCSNKKFASFELEIPLDVNEQAEIGNILYDMESEIKMLKDKLSKYKRIKDGMMEDLLTGKVRLSYE